MGIVHKLKPEIKNLIVEQKKLRPSLSCRAFTLLIEEKLKVKISKSSINAIFKDAGLSMPIGRRVKHKKQKVETLNDRLKLALVGPAGQETQCPEEGAKENSEEKIFQKIQQQQDALAQEAVRQQEEASKIIQQQEQLRKIQEDQAKRKEVEAKRQEELLKAQQEAKDREEEAARLDAQRKAEEIAIRLAAAKQAFEEDNLKKEEARLKNEEGVRLADEKAAQETLLKIKQEEICAREAGLKEEQEKWAKKAEQEKIIADQIINKDRKEPEQSVEEKILQEMQQQQDALTRKSANQAQSNQEKSQQELLQAQEETKCKEEETARKEEERKIQEEAAEISATVKAAESNKIFIKDDEFSSVSVLPQNRVSTAVILLKALDYLIGGSSQINAKFCKKLNRDPEQMQPLTEALIFESLFAKNNNLSELWSIIGNQYSQEILQNYSRLLSRIEMINVDTLHTISDIFTEARGVKVHFPDDDIVYFDGQLHTTWSTAYLPSDFSDSVYALKNNLNRYFFENNPIVLFTAPGYDIPPKEFFTLLYNFSNSQKAPDVLTIYGNKLEDLENISLPAQKTYSVVFCLWPWQFTSQRKVKKLSAFLPAHIESVNKDLYLAAIEMDLQQPALGRSISLKGCAVKTNLNEKTKLVILSNNLPTESLDQLAGLYLSYWPNLEESFQDFSRKIELSTYTVNVQKFSFLNNPAASPQPPAELKDIFANYVKMLDVYLRWYFLPSEYQEKDLTFTSENLYQLPAVFVASQDKACVKIQPGADYPYLKDLNYLVRRFNERRIYFKPKQLFSLESISRI
ncbi:MAG: hypothetical protein M0Q96_00625 [Candidatus Omnitrophica bacterium]|nr:hypothetical protein [Candidatus Omnitrophota bacterium]